jgi:hypothetical protein
MSDKRQKSQLVLAFREEDRSEAPMASAEGIESLAAKRTTESPAIGEQLMEVELMGCKPPDPNRPFGDLAGGQVCGVSHRLK